ncbi:MAG: acyl-CoA dehydrogenase [Pseudomonadota bacterium]
MSTIVNRRDLAFFLYEVFGLEQMLGQGDYAEFDRETIEAVLDTAEQIATERFEPLAAALDADEPRFVDGAVEMMPEIKPALDAFSEAGLIAAGFDAEVGGMQLPFVAQHAMSGMFTCANNAATNYLFLTTANANMLNTCASEELKARFLPPMLEGRWYGTMCLSETQAGSSLADIRTTATPRGDGTYAVAGSKMWISGGEQPMSENIVHMVLARTPDAPPGVRGISLFLVPKYRVDDAGNVGEKNHIALAGLNHKMGQRGTTNCLLEFGDGGESIGWLVGRENEGLKNMFHMMNEARIGVGLGAVMCGLGGYLYSLKYAQERLQGRPASDKSPESPQVPIIRHADVRRMLLAQKAWVEGGQALIYYCGTLQDRERLAGDDDTRDQLNLLLELLTPVAKSWPSEYCLEANKLAIQVLGGYGYTRDYPVERYYRDNRLNHIHEGTWGIQGLDILGRKVRLAGGAALELLAAEMQPTLEVARGSDTLSAHADALAAAWQQVQQTVAAVAGCEDRERALANATSFLDGFGHVIVSWLWLRQALVAEAALAENNKDTAFYEGKLKACRYFFRYELPVAITRLALVETLDDTCLTIEPTQFTG